ncbi:response regulator [Geodermatophilus sp. SYSU D00815]
MIKVLVVDDHAFVREALGSLFAETDDIDVVGECADGSEVVDAALRADPDVVLMDVAMPRRNGLEATRDLLAARPGSRVVMLTGTVTADAVSEAEELGVAGYLVKGEDSGDLPTLVRAIAAGGTVWCPLARRFLRGRG